jgi:hypothetical protein
VGNEPNKENPMNETTWSPWDASLTRDLGPGAVESRPHPRNPKGPLPRGLDWPQRCARMIREVIRPAAEQALGRAGAQAFADAYTVHFTVDERGEPRPTFIARGLRVGDARRQLDQVMGRLTVTAARRQLREQEATWRREALEARYGKIGRITR